MEEAVEGQVLIKEGNHTSFAMMTPLQNDLMIIGVASELKKY